MNHCMLYLNLYDILDIRLNVWARVTYICLSNLTIIGSDNGLSPGQRQSIIWTNPGLLLIGQAIIISLWPSLLTHKCVTRPQWINVSQIPIYSVHIERVWYAFDKGHTWLVYSKRCHGVGVKVGYCYNIPYIRGQTFIEGILGYKKTYLVRHLKMSIAPTI